MTTAPEPSGVLGVLRELYVSLFGVFFLVSLLLSVLLFAIAADARGTAQTVWLGLATSLLASAVFSSLQLLLTEQVSKRLLSATVANEMHEVADRVIAETHEQQERYVPIAVYEESGSPDGRFNRDLADDLTSTNRYIYYGLTGRYVGSRLLNLHHRISDVLVVICDPDTEAAINTRMLHSSAGPDFSHDTNHIQQELTADIDRCIVGLFASRRWHDTIEICLTSTPNFDRVEICDAASYLTLFSTRADQRLTYPQTLKFSPDSTFYSMMLRDTQRAAAAPGAKLLRLRTTTSQNELVDFYGDVLRRPVTVDELDDMEERFLRFSEEFHRQVERALGNSV